jgi:predicted nucleic acid-binding protein
MTKGPATHFFGGNHRRAVYDSLIVALAQDLGATGVTADEPMHRAVHADHSNIILLKDWKP